MSSAYDLFRLLDANTPRDRFPAAPQHQTRRAFSPNFDVLETEHEYVLEGELPGLSDKSHVSLEFTEAQTLLVRGRIERSLAHRPTTVEAVPDESEKPAAAAAGQKQPEAESKDARPKYWVSERTVGEFQRSFSFPGYVDVEKVHATLAHGILKIVVPKREKPTGRRIEIH